MVKGPNPKHRHVLLCLKAKPQPDPYVELQSSLAAIARRVIVTDNLHQILQQQKRTLK